MLRCKEGDLAVILRPGYFLGFVVNVGKHIGTTCATLISTGQEVLVVDGWEVKGLGFDRACEGDSYLQPIRPAPSGVTTETKKEITA